MARVLIALLAVLLAADERTPVPGFFDLPVTGGTATFEMLGLQPDERGHAVELLTREMFMQGAATTARAMAVRAFVADLQQPGRAREIAPDARPLAIAVPLTADAWRDALQLPGRADLFAALINNRAAMLVCAGAAASDPSTRALLERDKGLLRWIVRTAPAAFWTASRALKFDKDKLLVPGGAAAQPIWEALAVEKMSRPSDFLRALLVRDGGRLAWFYEAAGTMTPERWALAVGPGPVEAQVESVRSLYDAFRSADSNWHLENHPFLRGVADPWIVSSQVAIANGVVASPNAQWFWDEMFDRTEFTRRNVAGARRDPATPVTPGWLTHRITTSPLSERRARYDMVRFAQAVFPGGDTDRSGDVLIAMSGYRRYRGVLLTLDRLDISAPHVYARAVEAARRIDEELSGRAERQGVIAFQSALAIIERARLLRAIDGPKAESLIVGLADIVDPVEGTPIKRDRIFGAIVEWITGPLMNAMPPLVQPDQWTAARTAYESRLLQALAGRPDEPRASRLTWEGLTYRVDLFGSERARLGRIREQIDSPGLDLAIASGDNEKMASALLALIYTPALGDPEGPALLGADIAQRHNFGLTGAAGLRHESLAWDAPREQVGDGGPWRVNGSILGLDLALARIALRRIADNDMPTAPTINLNDQLAFARTVAAINPRDLRDADRDRLVAAIARGRERVRTAGANLVALSALAAEGQLSPTVRQVLPWIVTRMPESVSGLFSLRDLLWLGKPDVPASTLDAWGVYAESLTSRLRTAMPRPAPWENVSGRADAGLIATQAPDLVLRLAQETARLKLPAQIIPSLLMYAAQDYWHDVDSRFPDDWPAMTRQALALSATRVEDYVAALAGSGPLRPE